MSREEKQWSVETMTIEETQKHLKDIGDFLCMENNNNFGQGVCERAIELLKSEPEPTEFTKLRRANAELLLQKYPRNETASQSPLDECVLLDTKEVADLIFEDCDIIDRLTTENKAKDEIIQVVLRNVKAGAVTTQWVESYIEQALKGER